MSSDIVLDFTFEMDNADVHIYDGEGSLRVSIPVDIWLEIVSKHWYRYIYVSI